MKNANGELVKTTDQVLSDDVRRLIETVKKQRLTVVFDNRALRQLQQYVAKKLTPVIDDTHKQLDNAVSDFSQRSFKSIDSVTRQFERAQNASERITEVANDTETRYKHYIGVFGLLSIVYAIMGAGLAIFGLGLSKLLSLVGLSALWQTAVSSHGISWVGVAITLVVTLTILAGVWFLILIVTNQLIEWGRYHH